MDKGLLSGPLRFLRLLDPAIVPRVDVRPFVLDLITGSPEELSVDLRVESLERAVGKLLDHLERPELGVIPAGAVCNANDGCILVLSVRAKRLSGVAVKGSVELICWQVAVRAFDWFALSLRLWVLVIEATEPHCAVVSGQGPLAPPDLNTIGTEVIRKV